MSGATKIFTVRLPEEQVVQLEKLATIDGVAIAEEIRLAVAHLWKEKTNDRDFKDRVRKAYVDARKLLEELGDAQAVVDALGEAPIDQEAKRPAAVGTGTQTRG